MGIGVIINPGTGPVPNATVENAIVAAHALVADVASIAPRYDEERRLEGVTFDRASKLDSDGRFGFVFALGSECVEVEIPGWPVEKLRYLDDEGQNCWNFPRLYVDGSSWLWMYAITAIREALATEAR